MRAALLDLERQMGVKPFPGHLVRGKGRRIEAECSNLLSTG